MNKIPRYQREEGPPATSPLVKPPYELADRSGQIAFGASTAKIGSDVLDRIIRVRSINEYHEFIGSAREEEQAFENDLKANPAWPVEKITARKETMLANIRKARSRATTQIAKDRIADWYDLNVGLISERGDGMIDAIILKHNFDMLNLKRKSYRETGNIVELEAVWREAEQMGLVTAEERQLQFEQDMRDAYAVIERNEKAAAILVEEGQAEEWYRHFTINNDFTPEEAMQGIEEIPDKQIGDQRDKLRTRVKNWFAAKAEDERKRISELEDVIVEKIQAGNDSVLLDIHQLKGDDQYKWMSRWHTEVDRRLKSQEIVEDQLEIGRLNNLIEDIRFDRIALSDFKKQLDLARYPEKGKAKINDKTYSTLLNEAKTELSNYHNTLVSRFIANAKSESRAIEDPGELAMWLMDLSPEEKEAARRLNQDRIRQVNMFGRALNDYIQRRPEATRSELQQFYDSMWPAYQTWTPGEPTPAYKTETQRNFEMIFSVAQTVMEYQKLNQAGRVAGADEFVTKIENERQYTAEEKEWLSVQLGEMNDMWYSLNEATKRAAIDAIMNGSNIPDIGKQVRAEIIRKQSEFAR